MYAKLKLKPQEAYGLDLTILGDMILAEMKLENELFDRDMQLLAWQTSILMNSTGNYKKAWKPTDLYTPLAVHEEKEKSKEEYNPEKKKALQEELLASFKDSKVIIQ